MKKRQEKPITYFDFTDEQISNLDKLLSGKDNSYINQFWLNFGETLLAERKKLTEEMATDKAIQEGLSNCNTVDCLLNVLTEDDARDLGLAQRRAKYYPDFIK
jgi:hypothetical protein